MKDEVLAVPMDYGSQIQIYSGVARLSGKIWARLVQPDEGGTRTAFLIVHPTSNFLGHYALVPFAERGHAAVGLTTRYVGNDTSLLFENCVLDVAAAIRDMIVRGAPAIGVSPLLRIATSNAARPTSETIATAAAIAIIGIQKQKTNFDKTENALFILVSDEQKNEHQKFTSPATEGWLALLH